MMGPTRQGGIYELLLGTRRHRKMPPFSFATRSACDSGHRLFEEAFQFATAGRMTKFAKSFRFDLPNSFPGDVVLFAYLFERSRKAIEQSISLLENFAFTFVEAGENFDEFASEQIETCNFTGIFCRFVFDQISKMSFIR